MKYAAPGSPDWNRRRAQHLDETAQEIKTHGFTMTYIPNRRAVNSFAYTTGLTDHGLPELHLASFHIQLIEAIFVQIGQALITGHSNPARKPSQAATALDNVFVDVDLPNDDLETTTFGFTRLTMTEAAERPTGMAILYYGHDVPLVAPTTKGWPCLRCATGTEDAPCSCQFSCWWYGCTKLSDHQKSLSQDEWV